MPGKRASSKRRTQEGRRVGAFLEREEKKVLREGGEKERSDLATFEIQNVAQSRTACS
jgi:hypothetical protein